MREIRQPGPYSYVFSPYPEPIATVDPGETVAIFTEDAFGGAVQSEDDLPSKVLGSYLNPQTGPIYVRGAEPGDTLAVTIEAIEPTRDWAVSAFVQFFGGLTATAATRLLHEPLPERLYFYELRDGVFHHGSRIRVPWRPFVGTIGTAPEIEAISALTPQRTAAIWTAATPARATPSICRSRARRAVLHRRRARRPGRRRALRRRARDHGPRAAALRRDQGEAIAWPRIESPDKLMAVGSARPMEDAARIAYAELVEWLAADHGYERLDAYQLLTQLGELYVGNMVDTNYSLVAGVRKEYLLPA